MKSKAKRIVSFILAITVIFAMSGCGEKKQSADGVTTVKWYNIGTQMADDAKVMDVINEKLEKDYKLNLDLQVIDQGAYGDKMNMIISSGEEYDLCYTSNWLNVFSTVAAGGGFLDIDDKIRSNEYKKLYESLPEFVWEAAKFDGKIMAVPNYQMVYYQVGAHIPTKYIEKYNIDKSAITSMDDPDFEAMLKTFHEGEPDANVISIYQFQGMTVQDGYAKIAEVPFLRYNIAEGKVESMYEIEGVIKECDLFRDWYNKGYIRKDVISAENTKNEDDYMVWATNMSPGSEEKISQQKGEPITAIPMFGTYIEHGAGQSTMTAVNKASKNPDAALKIIEIFNTDKELYNTLVYGLENEHYTKQGDNLIEVLGEGKKYSKANKAWAYGNAFNANYIVGGSPVGTNEETDKINREAERSPLLGLSIDISAIKTEIAKINSARTEYKHVFYGAEEPASVLKELNEKLEIAGMSKVIEEIQKQVDAFFASKK